MRGERKGSENGTMEESKLEHWEFVSLWTNTVFIGGLQQSDNILSKVTSSSICPPPICQFDIHITIPSKHIRSGSYSMSVNVYIGWKSEIPLNIRLADR